VVIAVTSCGGCAASGDRSTAEGSAKDPITVTSCGRKVVFDTPPKSVLAIGSEAPALLAAAGAGDTVTHYAGSLEVPFDAEVKRTVDSAERVLEDSHEVSFETIINTGVDVAIGTDISPSTDVKVLADRLEKAGVKLLTVSGYCAGAPSATAKGERAGFDLIYRDIESYGKLFGTEQVAGKAITQLKERVSTVKTSMEGKPKRSVIPLYVHAEGPLGGYGGQALVSEQMTLLGLDNVFVDVKKRYFEPSSEEIVSADPEVVFALYLPTGSSALETGGDVVKELRSRPEVAGIDAVADDKALVPLNYYYTSASPLAVDGLELLAKQLR
jgi:iron complex transport system substrate-binding protein